jgi:phenylalanyl-tRNA synthetase beta chain
VAEALIRAGFEVEQLHVYGDDVRGVVVARVLAIEELAGFKKPIRHCRVDIGSREHEVVCGATNFVVGDLVPFATPGAVLPGGFEVGSRTTYGRLSDGMICSEQELGLADQSEGILVLAPDSPLGVDVVDLLELRDEVLDIAITPDRGYALSVRGLAREVATAFGLPFLDPAQIEVPVLAGGHEIRLEDAGCDRYVARTVEGFDPTVPSPPWLRRRLTLAGMRSISLAVDVTNHVMLELGQPLHAFDLDTLRGAVVVRRARAGERLTTLDGQDRALDPADLLITDDRGPIALAGVMGGQDTEISATTTRILLESAHFDASSVARSQRRHKLPSEASKRFERGVDDALAAAAAEAAVRMLVQLGGASAGPGTDADDRRERQPLTLPVAKPGAVAGLDYPREVVVRRLEEVGCAVEGDDPLTVAPPSWRPDLTGAAELVEEVIRLEGYDNVPVLLPVAPAGRGLTTEQRLRRVAGRALASAGLVEVVIPPFVGADVLARLGLAHHAPPQLLNPLSEEESLLRPSLLPGLLAAVHRNVGRGLHDVALFEAGHVFRGQVVPASTHPPADRRPTEEEVAALDASLPAQPLMAGLVLAGTRAGRPVQVGDAVEALMGLARALGLELGVAQVQEPPFHPGRTAALRLGGEQVGLAGELHPRVVAALELPARTVAAELDLGALLRAAAASGPRTAPVVSPYPPSSVDVALVVDDTVLAAEVETTLRSNAGELLEHLALFDVFAGPQVGEGKRSLAYSLRFRAPDRTLTDSEVLAARDRAVAAAGLEHGAVLRGV